MKTEIHLLDDHINIRKLFKNRIFPICLQEFCIKSVSAIFCLLLITFTNCTEKPETLPELSTIETAAADITSTSAILKGDLKSLGNMKIVEYGIEISKSMLFSASEIRVITTPAVTGIFQVEFTNLEPNTIYYYRAFASVNTGQVHPKEIPYLHFTTNPV